LENFFAGSDGTSEATPLGEIGENDGTLVHAVYSAGMVQDLGTFAGYKGAGAAKNNSGYEAGDSFGSGSLGDLMAFSAGGVTHSSSSGLNGGGDVFAGMNLGLSAAPGAFRSSGGFAGISNAAGGSRRSNGINQASRSAGAAGGGGGAGAGSASASGGPSVAAEASGDGLLPAAGKAEGGTQPAVSFAAATDQQAALLSAGFAAGIPELPFAESIATPDNELSAVQADLQAATDSRVPDFAATWGLFAAALAGLAAVRRISG